MIWNERVLMNKQNHGSWISVKKNLLLTSGVPHHTTWLKPLRLCRAFWKYLHPKFLSNVIVTRKHELKQFNSNRNVFFFCRNIMEYHVIHQWHMCIAHIKDVHLLFGGLWSWISSPSLLVVKSQNLAVPFGIKCNL